MSYAPTPAFQHAADYLSSASSLSKVSNTTKLEVLIITISSHTDRVLTYILSRMRLARVGLLAIAIWPLQIPDRVADA